MPAYFIACSDIVDQDLLNQYLAGAPASLADRDLTLCVFDVNSEPIEGPAPHRTVVIKFPDKAAAMDWYNSEAYQAVVGKRLAATKGFAVLVDGLA